MQKNLFSTILLTLLFTGLHNNLQAQAPDSILYTAETKYMQEKIYIQTDKNVYSSGETVWFKTYITADNVAGAISKTVFAELLNEKGNVLQRRMMPVVLSGAASDFSLPDTLSDTRLFIRAYTGWMLNFDSTLLSIKPINIIPRKGLPKKVPAASVYSITFFPEGGDLVENLPSRVAFKATDREGAPVFAKGDVLNDKNKVVASFTAAHDGMGVFSFMPLGGETYRAVWKDKSNKPHETALPAAKKQGVVMNISFSDNQLRYTLARPDSAAAEWLHYIVVAQIQQRMVYGAQINLTKKTSAAAPIPTDSLQDGVMQVTVFNDAMLPVAERLVFINNNNHSFITDLHLVEKNIAKRGRNVIQVDVGGKLLSNLSVAVTDADINPVSKNEENIYSQLLLSSDLKGYVYNPAYYFSGDDDSVKQHLDLVMMTNGWRRFKWEDLLADKWPVINYPPDDHIAITGKVLGLARSAYYGKTIMGILKTNNKNPDFFSIPINEQGDFVLSSQYFFDTAKFYYQLSNDKDKTLTSAASFNFKSNFIKAPPLKKEMLAALYLPERIDSSIAAKTGSLATLRRAQEAAGAKVQVLEEVKVVTKQKSLKEKLDKEYTTGFFSGGDGYIFTLEDDPFATSSPNLLTYLQGKVPGLQINATGEGSAVWRGSNTDFYLNETMSDLTQMQNIPMSDVAMVKVFRPPFMGGTGGGGGGAVVVYTKKGAANNSSFKALPFTNVYGYSPIREFYSPDYSTDAAPAANDYRTTLYWAPNVYIDKNVRRITLPFFNSDNCKKLRVIVEGLNELGQLTREEKIFE